MVEEIKELQKGITDILVAIGKIETEIKQLSSMSNKLAETERTVIRLEQSAKSAHKRIDALVSQVNEMERHLEESKKMAKDDVKWLWGAALGALAFAWKILESIKGGS